MSTVQVTNLDGGAASVKLAVDPVGVQGLKGDKGDPGDVSLSNDNVWTGDQFFASGRPWYSVTQFATGGAGTSADPWTGWEADVNALPVRAAVFFEAGYYQGSLTDHPENANYKQVIRYKNGWSIKGAGRGNTFIRLAPSSASQTSTISVNIMLNNQITSGGDTDIDVSDISFDGNAANQGSNIQSGVGALRVRRMHYQRVNVFNCQGDSPSGFGETVHFSASLSSDCSWTDCNAFTTAGTSASGFSGNSSTNLKWSGCNAYGMTVTNGFTHNSCGGISYVHCNAWLNGYYGFNSEASVDISYANCRAGGRSAIGAAGWPYSANTPLGNKRHGFGIVGTSRKVTLVGCQSLGNGTSSAGSYHGFLIQDVHGLTVAGCIGSDDQSTKTQAYGLAFSGTTSTSVNAVGNNWDGNLTGTVSGAGTYADDETLGHLKLTPSAAIGGFQINAQVPQLDLVDVNSGAEDWRVQVDGNELKFYSVTQGADIAKFNRNTGLLLPVVRRGLNMAEGANAKMGTATLSSGTATVSTNGVTANSRIHLTSQSDGGTPGFLRVSSRSAGVSFTITSSSGSDTSTVAWMIVEPT